MNRRREISLHLSLLNRTKIKIIDAYFCEKIFLKSMSSLKKASWEHRFGQDLSKFKRTTVDVSQLLINISPSCFLPRLQAVYLTTEVSHSALKTDRGHSAEGGRQATAAHEVLAKLMGKRPECVPDHKTLLPWSSS